MSTGPDTSIVDIHRAEESKLMVSSVEGEAWHVCDPMTPAVPLVAGAKVRFEDTVALGPAAKVVIGDLALSGGRRGRAHAFVRETAFRPSPNREDVPRLLGQLEQIEREMKSLGEDPLAMQEGPTSAFERAYAAEFGRLNLDPRASRELPEATARRLRALVLFVSEETAYVAFSQVTVPKLRTVMADLARPVHPHLVDERSLDELLTLAYGYPRA